MAQKHKEAATEPVYKIEYVSCAVSLAKGTAIIARVVNDSDVNENARVVIYQNTGAGAKLISDTSSVVTPSWQWSLAFTVTDPGEYWLRIQATSEFLIPQASFERDEAGTWLPIVVYKPGDFAVFDLVRKRRW